MTLQLVLDLPERLSLVGKFYVFLIGKIQAYLGNYHGFETRTI